MKKTAQSVSHETLNDNGITVKKFPTLPCRGYSGQKLGELQTEIMYAFGGIAPSGSNRPMRFFAK